MSAIVEDGGLSMRLHSLLNQSLRSCGRRVLVHVRACNIARLQSRHDSTCHRTGHGRCSAAHSWPASRRAAPLVCRQAVSHSGTNQVLHSTPIPHRTSPGSPPSPFSPSPPPATSRTKSASRGGALIRWAGRQLLHCNARNHLATPPPSDPRGHLDRRQMRHSDRHAVLDGAAHNGHSAHKWPVLQGPCVPWWLNVAKQQSDSAHVKLLAVGL